MKPVKFCLTAQAKRAGYGPDDVELYAVFPDGHEEQVGREQVAVANPPPREDAEAFVRQRTLDIADGKDWARARGLFRCNPDDPREKQVNDFIATAPWVWRKDVLVE